MELCVRQARGPPPYLVEEREGAVFLGQVADLFDRRNGAAHRVHGLEGDDLGRRRVGLLQQLRAAPIENVAGRTRQGQVSKPRIEVCAVDRIRRTCSRCARSLWRNTRFLAPECLMPCAGHAQQ